MQQNSKYFDTILNGKHGIFRDLKPFYMNHPTEVFGTDLSKYAASFSQKAKDFAKK